MGCTRRELVRGAIGLCGLAAAGAVAGCATPASRFEKRTCFDFDTVCTMGADVSASAMDEAVALCDRCERLLSRTIPSSDVGRINAARGSAVEVDPLTAKLIERALSYCEESGGLFDITIGAVSELWDFTEGVVPSDESIARAVSHVSWQGVEVSGNSVRLRDPEARLDLGGIAKGYITDLVTDLLAQRGARSAFVNLGGNVKVLGTKQDGSPWSVGVRDPWDQSGQGVVARMSVTEGSLVTSGLYERSFERDGRRYWHILDPRTGYPVQTDVVSASVYAHDSIDGDGYTKPLFMLDEAEALAFVQGHEGLQALLVDSQGRATMTPEASFDLV